MTQRILGNKSEHLFLCLYLVLFEYSVHQQGRLSIHLLSDSVSHGVVRLQAASEGGATVFVVDVLLSVTVRDIVELISMSSTHNTRLTECCTEKINILQRKSGRIFYSLNDVTDIHLRNIFAVRIRDLLFLLRMLRLFIIFLLYRETTQKMQIM